MSVKDAIEELRARVEENEQVLRELRAYDDRDQIARLEMEIAAAKLLIALGEES